MTPIVDFAGTCFASLIATGATVLPVFNLSPLFMIPPVVLGELPLSQPARVFLFAVLAMGGFVTLSAILNQVSYNLMKSRILKRRTWDLNICCGMTDGGGINADIVRHADVPRFVRIADIYKLPFDDNQFEHVLCSHTIEHVDDPERLRGELHRVGKQVTFVLPPLWDITAALNVLEHRHIFLTARKEHASLPRYVKLPLAAPIQRWIGQVIHA
ncbi:methyltransferase domain-containing protein [candidate division GN15 bacterium]|nr:methyltransferase domain-containing protein [candidate division GN15 bacterium]